MTTNEVMDVLEKKMVKACLVCGEPDKFNVCIICDAKVTARKAYKRCFVNRQGVEKSNVPEYRKVKEREYYKEEAKKYYTSPGSEGLLQEERNKFFRVYNMEYEKLNDFEYMCKIMRYVQNGKGEWCFKHDDSKWFDELKYFYKNSVTRGTDMAGCE